VHGYIVLTSYHYVPISPKYSPPTEVTEPVLKAFFSFLQFLLTSDQGHLDHAWSLRPPWRMKGKADGRSIGETSTHQVAPGSRLFVEFITALCLFSKNDHRSSRANTSFQCIPGRGPRGQENTISVLHRISATCRIWRWLFKLSHTHPTAFTQYRQVKAVIDNYDASSLASFLESIGHFLSLHEVCTEMPPTVTTNETVVKFPVELLSTLAFATKQIKQENVVSPSLV
jgi:hypothetical protein